ncbi:hypothetical protein TrLO_g1700 [Triparma laevis f. longispina]|nr:hypothetical protein TrLO_g1700 [Triparma laevis f. longispina]
MPALNVKPTRGVKRELLGALLAPSTWSTTNRNKKCICFDSFIIDDGKCACEAGKILVNGKCRECEDGRFKIQTGTDSCNVCDREVIKGALETIFLGANKTSATSCAYGKGKFSAPPDVDNPESTLDLVCKDCSDINHPEGFDCSMIGLTLATLPLKDGFWRRAPDNHNIVECENLESCTHSSNHERCAEGHTGPICSVCMDGYNKDSVRICESCASTSVSIGFYVLLVILGITTLYLVLRKIFGKENLSISNVTQEITKVTSGDNHWSQRL